MSIWKIPSGWFAAALMLGWLCSGSAVADLVKLKTGGDYGERSFRTISGRHAKLPFEPSPEQW